MQFCHYELVIPGLVILYVLFCSSSIPVLLPVLLVGFWLVLLVSVIVSVERSVWQTRYNVCETKAYRPSHIIN